MGFEIKDNVLVKYKDEEGVSEITVPDGVTEIAEGAFVACDITKVILPSSIEHIRDRAFLGCLKLTEIVMHDGITSIGEEAFSDCSIVHLQLPRTLKTIEQAAFMHSDSWRYDDLQTMEEFVIPESVVEIGKRAFERLKVRKIGRAHV